jgi:hypothetical protein
LIGGAEITGLKSYLSGEPLEVKDAQGDFIICFRHLLWKGISLCSEKFVEFDGTRGNQRNSRVNVVPQRTEVLLELDCKYSSLEGRIE